jgi:hypothetical protein
MRIRRTKLSSVLIDSECYSYKLTPTLHRQAVRKDMRAFHAEPNRIKARLAFVGELQHLMFGKRDWAFGAERFIIGVRMGADRFGGATYGPQEPRSRWAVSPARWC